MTATAMTAETVTDLRVPGPSRPAAASGPGHTPAVRQQRVRVPLRLVVSACYPDVALSVYVKVAALGARPQGCEAKAVTLAGYLGMSTASVERGLTALSRPHDGVVELGTVRRTLAGGRGTSAVRRVRPVAPGEGFVWVPVAAAEDLTPRQLRAYAVIAYTERMRMALTESELAGYLRHHSGKRAGEPISADAAGAVVDEVEAARWVTVQRRAGAQGRHRLLAHDFAPEAARNTVADGQERLRSDTSGAAHAGMAGASEVAGSSAVGEGSGPVVGEGSLAYRESLRTDSPEDGRATGSPAVGEVPVGEAVANPSASGVPRGGGGCGLALRAEGTSQPAPTRTGEKRTTGTGGGRSAYRGPQLVMSARVYSVLEPVHGLLARVGNDFVMRQIAREVGHQLDAGMAPDRLRHRLELRYARVVSQDIRDVGRWLLGVALPRWGCGHWDCEAGTMWTTGRPCEVCAEVIADRAAARERARRQKLLCPQDRTRRGPSGS
jgi:hypothetical protein